MTGTPPARPDRGAPLTLATLPSLLERLHRWLGEHRDQLDALNVFPVPDSDTGTNLVATVRAAMDAVEAATGDHSARSAAATRGALRGARGNSGVILAQLLAVLTAALEAGPVDGDRLAEVLSEAVERAYGAVADPVEGTMLTALRAAADGAGSAAGDGRLADVTGGALEAAGVAVAHTPEQLAVLAEAGVVDAGARGLEVVLAALDQHVTGRTPMLAPVDGRGVPTRRESDGPGFEVQYVLEIDDRPAEAAAALRRRLSELGDSVVVASADRLLSVHVHTDRVAAAIEAGRRHGPADEVAVTALTGTAACEAGNARAVGVLAVVSGPGLVTLVARSGATALHTAGPPDARAIETAAREVAAEAVVLLPGHAEVAAGALAVGGADGQAIHVVEAADNAPAVLAALAVLDPARDLATVVEDLGRTASAVVAGEVTLAGDAAGAEVRGAGAGFLARLGGEAVGAADNPLEALDALIARAPAAAELVTLVTGEGVGVDERDGAEKRIREALPGTEVTVVEGGQPTSRYVLGFE